MAYAEMAYQSRGQGFPAVLKVVPIKALNGFEEPDWAVKVIITVEDEGFGELERLHSR